jgi:hypothetical protein
VGIIWATECRVGEFLTIFRIYAEAQLVFASGNDPAAWGYHDVRGIALWSSSCRLAHTSHGVTEMIRLLQDPTLIQQELDRRLAAARDSDRTRKREQSLQGESSHVGKGIEGFSTRIRKDS